MIAVVQDSYRACANCLGVSFELQQPVNAHDLLVAFLFTCAPQDSSCSPLFTDLQNLAWSGPLAIGTGGHGGAYLWYACDALPGDEGVTEVQSTSSYGVSLHVLEVSGVAPANCLDAFGSATGTGDRASVTTATAVQQDDEYVIAFFADFSAAAAATVYTAGTGFQQELASGTTMHDAAFSEDATATTGLVGPRIATATKTNPTDTWQGLIATFVAR